MKLPATRVIVSSILFAVLISSSLLHWEISSNSFAGKGDGEGVTLRVYSCSITKAGGIEDLQFRFKGDPDELFSLDSFVFDSD